MPVGGCSCGAVFACDVTGHSLGAALVEALVFSCQDDWDRAWGLASGIDFQQEEVERYDIDTHLVVPGGTLEGRRIRGVLMFVRLEGSTSQPAKPQTVDRAPGQSLSTVSGKSSDRGRLYRRRSDRKETEQWVLLYDREKVRSAAAEDKRVLRDLQRLLYSGDRLLRSRAADLLGVASGVVALQDPDTVSTLLQRLIASVSDSAASSWGALDAVGEIIRNQPDLFGGYMPHLLAFLRDRDLCSAVLWNLGRIAEKCPARVVRFGTSLLPLLNDPDPLIRGYSARLAGILRLPSGMDGLRSLLKDAHEIAVYHDGEMELTTVGRLALRAIEEL